MLKFFFFSSLSISCFLTGPLHVRGQGNWQDSLQRLIREESNDSLRLSHEIIFASFLRKEDADSARKVLEKIKKESQEKKLFLLAAKSCNILGAYYFDKGDYINSILQDEESAKLYESMPQGNKRDWGMGAAWVNLGGTYSLLNEWDIAQDYYYKGLEILEKIHDSAAVTSAYFNLAFLFLDMQEWDKAYAYFKRATDFRKGSPDYDASLQTTSRLAAVCARLGRFREAMDWLRQCDSLIDLPVRDLGRIYYYDAWGKYYYFTGSYQKSGNMLQRSMVYARQWQDPYFITDAAMVLGIIHLRTGNTDSANYWLSFAYDTAQAYHYLPKIRSILNDQAEYYASIGQYEKAYSYRTRLMNFTDSLVTLQNHNRILLNDARYQSAKKEEQISQLEQDKKIQSLSIRQQTILNYVLLGGLLAAGAIGFLAFRNFRNKQQLLKQTEQLQAQRIRELEQEKQLIAVDSILKGQEEERSRLARDLHDGLGGMLSGVKLSLSAMKGNTILSESNGRLFARALEQLDQSILEMRRVAHNMMPEALVKFGLRQAIQDYCDHLNDSGRIKVKTQFHGLESRLEPSEEIIVYRIIQELLNNVVKHAEAGEALVQLMKHEENLAITVEDNGKGFNTAGSRILKGAGLDNIRSRVDYLKGEMDIQSDPGKGTSVHIECKLN